MPFHFVRSSARHPRSMSRQAYRDDRARFHHELDARGIRLARGSGRRSFDWLWDQTTDLLIANPYPTASDLWRRTNSSFLGEEEFDDLYFRDFVTVGRRVARWSQASLGGTPN